jgi:uncharacterized protein YbaR (Trm112 family)
MPLDPRLLEILACPEDKGALLYFAADAGLYNPRSMRWYEIKDDVPQLLVEESKVLSREEHEKLMAKPHHKTF